jgi:polysaccharide export outer membrane protein
MRGAWDLTRRIALVSLAAVGITATGCVHDQAFIQSGGHPEPGITVPAPGTVPVELAKVTLPAYVVEPPDQLLIEVVTITQEPKLQLNAEKNEYLPVKDPEGKPIYEYKAFSLPVQQVSGQFSVRPDGTVLLGIWGTVRVAGLTLDQIAEAIRDHISQQEDPTKPGAKGIRKDTLRVIVDVLQYNSKRFYVIFDGGGNGEQVVPFPVTGSETVLDAIGNVSGLPSVASKRNIWIARRTPHLGQPQQILPVDWVGITQHGQTVTNYQIMPGDRVYVKALKIVTFDTTLARIIQPIERLFGVTLLGTSTVNSFRNNGNGTNNTGGL